jgi:MoxR-like ATPase
MAEKQVTLDNVTHPLDDLFFVLGTQNPLDLAGTYPLPQVQLDRFLFKIPMRYVDAVTEEEILKDHASIQQSSNSLNPVCSREDILGARAVCDHVFISDQLRKAIVEIVQATRNNPLIQFGASTRAALMIQRGVKAWALLEGRSFGTEDDLKLIAPYVLLHRLRFHAGAGSSEQALQELMAPALDRLIKSTS